jgi:hypothetical protein
VHEPARDRRRGRQGLSGQAADQDYQLPEAPRILGSLRSALVDFFYNSWRLVPANLIWAAVGLGVLAAFVVWPIGGLLALALLALPTAGVFRLAALIVRDRPVSFSDGLSAWRAYFGPAVVGGVALTLLSSLLLFNVSLGFDARDPLGWAFGTAAVWGLLVIWTLAIVFWPLLVDPQREREPVRSRLRLAGLLVLVFPFRFGLLLLLMVVLFVASSIFLAALVTISIAFMALVLARYVLPAADRLEGRRTRLVSG